MRVVVAGFGNVLRGDDGAGVAVAQQLLACGPPPEVEVLEVGIGGIHLVQTLLEGVDALVVVDTVDTGRPPGTVVVMEPDVLDVAGLDVHQRRDQLADMHLANPDRALMVARALGVLPARTWLVGLEAAEPDEWGHGLSAVATTAVPVAVAEVRRLVSGLGVPWPHSGPG